MNKIIQTDLVNLPDAEDPICVAVVVNPNTPGAKSYIKVLQVSSDLEGDGISLLKELLNDISSANKREI